MNRTMQSFKYLEDNKIKTTDFLTGKVKLEDKPKKEPRRVNDD